MKLISNLPQEIILNHIIPYTYSPQPKLLCKDIKTYYYTFGQITKLYQMVFSKKTWTQILKLDVSEYYCETILKIQWIPNEPQTNEQERKEFRILWGKFSPVHRLKCMMKHYREFTEPNQSEPSSET